nr:hypothetical protein [Tanacetum cinerariifolium]
MTLFNGICDNCIYGAGMPIICTTCGGIVRGELCLPCDLREKNLYNCDPNAYSFNNSNYFPQLQDENYLCNLCENNSHDDYDCQQQFMFVYEQEPSYNQNNDDNYYPHESPSYPCCDYCRGSHETFQCKPDNQNVDFSGYDQIQTLQYPDVNPPSLEIESLENSSEETVVSKTNQEPPQDSDIHQLIEECSIKIPEEQKQKMEDTMFELVKICQEKELLCIHDDVDDLIESALDSKLLLINLNSQRLDKKEQEVKNVVEQAEQPEHLLSIEYEHLCIPPEIESDEVTESNAENFLPIPSKCEVTLEDEIKCDIPAKDDCSPVFTTFSNPLFKDNDDLDSSDDESLPDEDEEIDIVTETDDVLPPSDDNDDDLSNDLLLGEADLFLSDNSIPSGIENVVDDPEGDVCFLKELLINDSILSHESYDSSFEDKPLISRPPPEPPDVESFFDLEPEDYPPEIKVILCWIYFWFLRSSYPLIDFSLG